MSVPLIPLNDGRAIPQVGLGVFRVPPEQTERVVSEALELGYRHIDTAAAYQNEAAVGRAVRASGLHRDEIFITTKLFNDAQGPDLAPAAFERSLDALGLDEVDLYLIHWPAPRFDRYVATWRVLEELRAQGRARSIGVSNFLVHHLERLLAETDVIPAVNQIELQPWLQQNELRQFCRGHGIAVEAWGPLGAGQLSRVFADPRIAGPAARHGVSPEHLVLRWHVQCGHVIFPKSTRTERLAQNLDLFGFELDEAEMAGIASLDRGGRIGFHPDEWH